MYLFYILFPYFQIINCARNITLRKTPKKEASKETFGKIFAAVEQEEEEVEVENNKIIKKWKNNIKPGKLLEKHVI